MILALNFLDIKKIGYEVVRAVWHMGLDLKEVGCVRQHESLKITTEVTRQRKDSKGLACQGTSLLKPRLKAHMKVLEERILDVADNQRSH